MAFVRAARKDEIPAGDDPRISSGRQDAGHLQRGRKVLRHSTTLACIAADRSGRGTEGQDRHLPWHGWQYDVTTGKAAANPAVGVACYPSRCGAKISGWISANLR